MSSIEDYTEVKRWVSTIRKENTKKNYLSALRAYTSLTKKSPKQLIDEAVEDAKLDMRNRTDVVKSQLFEFHKSLLERGLSEGNAKFQFMAVRSFYSMFGVSIKLQGREVIPTPRVEEEHKSKLLTATEVKKIVESTLNLRDKAIFTMIFQTGMRVSNIVDLVYSNVREQLEAKATLLTITMWDKKSSHEFTTFAGRDSIEALNSYLRDLERKGVKLADKDPLFIKETIYRKVEGKTVATIQGIDRHHIEATMRDAVARSGLTGNINPKSLRESFTSIMAGAGVGKSVYYAWTAHKPTSMDEAYDRVPIEKQKEIYMKFEGLVSLNGAYIRTNIEELKQKNDELTGAVKVLTEMQGQQTQLITKLNTDVDKLVGENGQIRQENAGLSDALKNIMEVLEENAEREKAYQIGIDSLKSHINSLAKRLGESEPYEEEAEREKTLEKMEKEAKPTKREKGGIDT